MKKILTLFTCVLFIQSAQPQSIAINNDGSQPNASAILDIKNANKGLLIPRVNLVSETDVTTIPSPALSLLVFNNNAALPNGQGYYFWNGSTWIKLATITTVNNTAWSISGNSINPNTDFIGTTNNASLIFKTNNVLSGKLDPANRNVLFGEDAGASTTGNNNNFIGYHAGNINKSGNKNIAIGGNALSSNTTGGNNVAIGSAALKSASAADNQVAVGDSALYFSGAGFNTAIGAKALFSNNGSNNVAMGYEALFSNTTGNNNTANGNQALFWNNTGIINTATGFQALCLNISGNKNTATGALSLFSNSAGDSNTATGYQALRFNISGSLNTATGVQALFSNTTGRLNTADGYQVMDLNTTGYNNVATGYKALHSNTTGNNNTAVGYKSLEYNVDGNNNTSLGYDAGPLSFVSNLTNTTAIGYNAAVTASNTMVFGDANVTGWAFGRNNAGASDALIVGLNSTNGNGAYLTKGGTWTNTSSRLKKDNFTDLDLESLLQKIKTLPIQKWKYKGTNEYHIGPVAEDFYKVFGLGTDDEGISTVDPAGIALAAIQEQQRMIEKQNELIIRLEKRIEMLEKK
ncbi:MAG: tail fiber domain-containing protein [Ginsengibacter sp.]